jgi:hypothetical protein
MMHEVLSKSGSEKLPLPEQENYASKTLTTYGDRDSS